MVLERSATSNANAAAPAEPSVAGEARREAHDDPILAEARSIVFTVLRERPVRVFLCGSRARGHAAPLSDIDIAILPLSPLPPHILSELREAFEDSTIPYEVDIIDLSTVSESFRHKVLSEGIAWNA
jgi:predicted nucleotidyltransferase